MADEENDSTPADQILAILNGLDRRAAGKAICEVLECVAPVFDEDDDELEGHSLYQLRAAFLACRAAFGLPLEENERRIVERLTEVSSGAHTKGAGTVSHQIRMLSDTIEANRLAVDELGSEGAAGSLGRAIGVDETQATAILSLPSAPGRAARAAGLTIGALRKKGRDQLKEQARQALKKR